MTCPYHLGTMKVTITATNTYNNAILVQNTSNTSSDGLLVYLYNSNAGNIGTAITLGTPFTPEKSQVIMQIELYHFMPNLDIKGICRV